MLTGADQVRFTELWPAAVAARLTTLSGVALVPNGADPKNSVWVPPPDAPCDSVRLFPDNDTTVVPATMFGPETAIPTWTPGKPPDVTVAVVECAVVVTMKLRHCDPAYLPSPPG